MSISIKKIGSILSKLGLLICVFYCWVFIFFTTTGEAFDETGLAAIPFTVLTIYVWKQINK